MCVCILTMSDTVKRIILVAASGHSHDTESPRFVSRGRPARNSMCNATGKYLRFIIIMLYIHRNALCTLDFRVERKIISYIYRKAI